MNQRHGEVWLVDMGMTAKTRPAVVLIADHLSAPRSLIIHIPITRQNRGSELEVPLGHLPFRRTKLCEDGNQMKADRNSFPEFILGWTITAIGV
jgi:mRNA-degrading endonuclease toxin of MazEF toxin-antitoxin module